MLTDPNTLSGQTLGGRYQILRDMGEEALGHVYAARDLSEGGRLVQVKAIRPSVGGNQETFARFGREISASFMVSHPNTVEVTDYGQQDEVRYLVSEYLAARPVSRDLQKGPLSAERVAAIGAQVAAAIGAAHQEGIVHRALSPENVLLLDNAKGGADFVKVRDFGMAKLDDESDEEVTATGVRVGNPAYMAPEYIETGRFHNKGDLYALGCLLFELASGRPPFQGERHELLEKQVEGRPPRLSEVAECPDWLDELVADLLAKKPGDRPGAYKVVQRLEEGVGHGLHPPELWPIDGSGDVQRGREETDEASGSRFWIGLVALIVLGGLAGAVVLVAAIATVALVLSVPS